MLNRIFGKKPIVQNPTSTMPDVIQSLPDELLLEIINMCISIPLSHSKLISGYESNKFTANDMKALLNLKLVSKRFQRLVDKLLQTKLNEKPISSSTVSEIKTILQEIINNNLLNKLPEYNFTFSLNEKTKKTDDKKMMEYYWDLLLNNLNHKNKLGGLNFGSGYYAFPSVSNELIPTGNVPQELPSLMKELMIDKITAVVFLLTEHTDKCKQICETPQEKEARIAYLTFQARSNSMEGGLTPKESDEKNLFIYNLSRLKKYGAIHRITLFFPPQNNASSAHNKLIADVIPAEGNHLPTHSKKLPWLLIIGLSAAAIGIAIYAMTRNKELSNEINFAPKRTL